jgi:ABC-type multidrug transport system ATPase subunit
LQETEIAEAKNLLRDLIARGKTVVLGCNALMDVKDLCDRLVILHDGKIQAAGTLPELLAGSSAIRFLPAILPAEMVERVLAVLREEILSAAEASASPKKVEKPTMPIRPVPALGKPSAPPAAPSNHADPIDHEKLQGLVKPPPAD